MKKITLFLFTGLLINLSAFSQTVTTFTGGTPDDGIALDANGNIYCSNYVGDTVFKFTPAGDVSSFVTGLNTPNGLAFNSSGELYVCDGVGNTVYKFDIDGNQLESYTNPGHPSGVIKSFDSETMIFTEYTGNTINAITSGGVSTEISGDPLLNGPVGLAYDDNNELYVGNYNDRKIYKVLSDGSLEYIATVGNSSNLGFITYAQGMLWGTVLGEHKIYRINPNAIDDVTLFAGSTAGSMDGDISEATFSQPNGIAFNDAGDTMYVTDFGTKNVRIISGIILGVEDNEGANFDLKIYPNPVKDTLFIEGMNLDEKSYSLRIIDVSGKQVYAKKGALTAEEISQGIDVSNLNKGVYFMKISSGEKTTTKKFIK